MTRLSACLLSLPALVALGIRTPCWADDAIERERMIREREQEIIRQKETEREARKATEVQREKEVARQRERENATARQRELERNTRASIDSVVVELARKLAGAAPILVVQMGADAAILQGGQDIGMTRGERVRCFHRGTPIVVNGEQVGFDEKFVTEGSIREVREQLAFAEMPDAVQAGDVCCHARSAAKLRVAVRRQERESVRALVVQRQRSARELLATGKPEAADQMLAVALLLAPEDPETASLAREIRSSGRSLRSTDSVQVLIQPKQ